MAGCTNEQSCFYSLLRHILHDCINWFAIPTLSWFKRAMLYVRTSGKFGEVKLDGVYVIYITKKCILHPKKEATSTRDVY